MRLIDAEELKKKAYPFPCAIGTEYAVTLRDIDQAPAIDAVPMDDLRKCLESEIEKRILTEKTNRQILENYVPVVHAKWIQSKTHQDYFHCSCCKVSNKMKKSCNIYILPKYCNCCGAKMDGGKDDENA